MIPGTDAGSAVGMPVFDNLKGVTAPLDIQVRPPAKLGTFTPTASAPF